MPWTEQLPSGNYRACYRDPEGKKRRLPGTYTHKRAAQNAAAAAEAEARSLGWRDPDAALRTWGDWVTEWAPTRAIEPGTAKVDNGRLERTLRPKWGSTPLAHITRHDVRAWAQELRDTGLAPATVQRHVTLLSASLNAAVEAEIIPSNPAARLKLPQPQNLSERTFSRTEQHAIFEHLPTDQDRALVGFLLGTGARWGEAVAIQREHFNLEHGTIRIRAAWDNKTKTMKPYTKGKRHRTVPIQPWLRDLLDPILEATPRGLIFTSRDNTPVDYSNWRNKVWKPALAAAGITDGTIHTLRHTYATEQLDAGLSLAEVATLLGHQSMTTTERYTHRDSKVNPIAAHAIADPRSTPPEPEPDGGRDAEVIPLRRRG